MCRRFPALRAGRLQGRGAQGGQLGRVRRAGRGERAPDRVSSWGWTLQWARVAAPGRRLPRVPGACCALRSSRASGCRSGPVQWFSRMTAPKMDVVQVVGPITIKTVGEARLWVHRYKL